MEEEAAHLRSVYKHGHVVRTDRTNRPTSRLQRNLLVNIDGFSQCEGTILITLRNTTHRLEVSRI
jgi:hypothetical protein